MFNGGTMENAETKNSRFADELGMPLCGAVTWSVVILPVSGLFPDGWDNQLVGTSTVVSIGVFWLASIYILIVHRRNMSRLDWLFIKHGIPATSVVSYGVFRIVELLMR
jgi:hypothetical protein